MALKEEDITDEESVYSCPGYSDPEDYPIIDPEDYPILDPGYYPDTEDYLNPEPKKEKCNNEKCKDEDCTHHNNYFDWDDYYNIL